MRTITRFVLAVLHSLGGIGPLSMGGELPGTPQDLLVPEWVRMSFDDFPFPERTEIELARKSAQNPQDWRRILRKLFYIFRANKISRKGAAILLNNMAYSAHRGGKRRFARLIIYRAGKIKLSEGKHEGEVEKAIKKNLRLFG